MNRNVLTTIGGILLVTVVVVGTFMYGDEQRKKQLASDNTAAKQEQAKESPSPAPAPTAATTNDKAKTDTKAQASKDKPKATATSPTPPAVTQTPKTGSGVVNVVAMSLMAMTALAYYRSRKKLSALPI